MNGILKTDLKGAFARTSVRSVGGALIPSNAGLRTHLSAGVCWHLGACSVG